MKVGQKIKELREKKNLTQEDLGRAVGAKQPRDWGSKLESGFTKNLKMEHAIRLAALLGVDTSFFYTNDSTVEFQTSEKLNIIEDPLMDFKILAQDPLLEKKTNKEIIQYLTEENRRLFRENDYLKSMLLKHKIDVYNTEYQNDTV